MNPEPTPAAMELVKQETAFVIKFFEAAELEARATERYLLVGLGAMYSYLAAQGDRLPFHSVAWYAPVLVVLFAAVRSVGLAWRQRQILDYLAGVEAGLMPVAGSPGWAQWYRIQKPLVAMSAAAFYLLLLAVTIAIAVAFTSRSL